MLTSNRIYLLIHVFKFLVPYISSAIDSEVYSDSSKQKDKNFHETEGIYSENFLLHIDKNKSI